MLMLLNELGGETDEAVEADEMEGEVERLFFCVSFSSRRHLARLFENHT